MPTVTTHAPGTFCWPELATSDVTGAKKFYTTLFGWQFNDNEMGPGMTYTIYTLNGRDVAAMMTLQPEMLKGRLKVIDAQLLNDQIGGGVVAVDDHRFERAVCRRLKTSGRAFGFVFGQNRRRADNSRRYRDHHVNRSIIFCRSAEQSSDDRNQTQNRQTLPTVAFDALRDARQQKRFVVLDTRRAVDRSFCKSRSQSRGIDHVFRFDLHFYLNVLIWKHDRRKIQSQTDLFIINYRITAAKTSRCVGRLVIRKRNNARRLHRNALTDTRL